ncbi:MAG: hypothetical protein QOF77_1874 [Solirubrobacteraceae bacterium]|jgi:hypothetical protein|nr:hypothetical protein [Solirubrobacteraceae bacterium]
MDATGDGPDPNDSTAAGGASTEDRRPNNMLLVVGGTTAMIVVGLALVASLVNLWPVVDRGTVTSAQGTQMVAVTARATVHLFFGLVAVKVTTSTALLLLVLIVGASGSLIHAATSFADFVGNRRLYASWAVWYLLRLIVGMTLALLLYFAVRGGFFSASSQSADVNPYGIAALAGLAGLFSKQATDKLREVFETLFQVDHGGDGQRKDDLTAAAPTVSGIDPPHVESGRKMFKLTVNGAHFVPSSMVRVNGVAQTTRFVSSQQLEATVPDELLETEGSLQVTVFTGPPGGGESTPAILGVAAPADPPAPAGPAAASAGTDQADGEQIGP